MLTSRPTLTDSHPDLRAATLPRRRAGSVTSRPTRRVAVGAPPAAVGVPGALFQLPTCTLHGLVTGGASPSAAAPLVMARVELFTAERGDGGVARLEAITRTGSDGRYRCTFSFAVRWDPSTPAPLVFARVHTVRGAAWELAFESAPGRPSASETALDLGSVAASVAR